MTITEEIINKIEYFPQLPGTAYQVLGHLDAPGATETDLLNVLEYDIATTTNLLKLCNTPGNTARFGLKRRVGSLKEALDRIGAGELKKMIAMTASTDIFAHPSGSGYEAGKGEMRRHSIAAAVISRHLKPFAPELGEDLFTTCLLHDIGKLILNEYIGDHMQEIYNLIHQKGHDFAAAEKEIIGMTHAEVGARIMQKWEFPEDMVTAVQYHHDPQELPDSPLTHFVSLADIIAMMMGFTTGFDALDYKTFPELYRKYKMKEKHIEHIMNNAVDEITNAIPFHSDGSQKINNTGVIKP
jgi:putative nucleotidyltransferase with HDIG domain